jgi:hypothetical protein
MVWFSFDQHIFRHPWEQVVEAALRKYPNPETPNVSSTDIVDRSISSDGVLKSTISVDDTLGVSGLGYFLKAASTTCSQGCLKMC